MNDWKNLTTVVDFATPYSARHAKRAKAAIAAKLSRKKARAKLRNAKTQKAVGHNGVRPT